MVFAKPALFELAAEIVRPDFFSEEAYGRLWEVVASFHERGSLPTAAMVMEGAATALGWERADVARLLAKFLGNFASLYPPQFIDYANLLRDAWMRRQMFDIGDEIKAKASKPDFRGTETAAEMLESIEERLYGLSASADTDDRGVSLRDAVAAGMQQAFEAQAARDEGKMVGVPSGISAVDRKLGGFRAGDVVVIASRPGMGKTAFAEKIADSGARQFLTEAGTNRPKWVAFYSLEMSADQLGTRHAAGHARVSFERIRRGEIGADEIMRLNQSSIEIGDLPIWIDDTPAITLPAIRMRARRLARRKGGLGLIVIDYLQLIGLTREQRRDADGNRVRELSMVTAGLKVLAKQLQVPIVVLSQLSREVEKREDKRPQLSDLRESGSIEQDADLVMFLYREAYYLQQKPPTKRERETEIDYQSRRSEWIASLDKCKESAELILSKNRHGSTGILPLRFVPEFVLFTDDDVGDATPDANHERKQQLRMDLQTAD